MIRGIFYPKIEDFPLEEGRAHLKIPPIFKHRNSIVASIYEINEFLCMKMDIGLGKIFWGKFKSPPKKH